MTGAFDRRGHLALMLRAHARLPPRPNLPAIGQVVAQRIGILVVNETNLLYTETTFLAPPPIVSPATAPAVGMAGGSPSAVRTRGLSISRILPAVTWISIVFR